MEVLIYFCLHPKVVSVHMWILTLLPLQIKSLLVIYLGFNPIVLVKVHFDGQMSLIWFNFMID